MNTDIDVVNFNRIEYMDLLNKVIDVVLIKFNTRAKEIEDWKNNDVEQSLEITNFKLGLYEKAKWDREYEYDYVNYDNYIFSKYKYYNPIESKVVVEEIVTEYISKTAIEQTWWEILCGKEIQYIETPCTKVEKKEVVQVETMEEYWDRIDFFLETPEFTRAYDRLMFYRNALLAYNKILPLSDNEFTSELHVLCSDLKAVQTSPDASYTLDGKTFRKYTRHLMSEEITPQ